MSAPKPPTTDRADTEVRLEDLCRRYGPVRALDGLTLTLKPGEMVALLGPSGCGKTTTLRVLAGLEDADAGRVVVGGKDVTNLPASRRDMGMVFQAYSLFPHMTAIDNVAFGLRLRHVPGQARSRRVQEMLELVGLSELGARYPHQMSGGQRQRIALARALAISPQVLLLDEPLAALDAQVRAQLRDEIRRIQLEVGTTTLFVTHDQEEALAIADRIGVMNGGRLEQVGPPHDVYHRPETAFVAEFVGLSNRLPAVAHDGYVDIFGSRLPLINAAIREGRVIAIVRPEGMSLSPADETAGDPALPGTVKLVTFQGPISRLTVVLDAGATVVVIATAAEAHRYPPDSRVNVRLSQMPVLAIHPAAVS